VPTLIKSFEYRWRRALLAAGHRPFSGHATASPQDLVRLPPRARILAIRFDRIGDVLVAVPVLRALRVRYPEARLELLVSQANGAVADAVSPFVNRVWVYGKTVRSAVGLLRDLRHARYDAIVDLIDHPSTTAQLVIRWCRPGAAIGLLHAEAGLYSHAAPTLDPAVAHPVERFAQLLLPFGIDPAGQPLDLEYRLTPDDVARAGATLGPKDRPWRLGVNLSTRRPERDWGASKYIGLIRYILERHPRFAVCVCGAPPDAAEVTRVAAAANAQAVPPSASLREFAAIIHEFDLLVTPDTAAVHLAAAWKIPSVVLYHAVPGVAPWVPYRTPCRAVMGTPDIPSIPFAQVSSALDSLIAERFGPSKVR
jgi:heptosyltransferase-2